jgi:hypothetical protein
VNDVSVTALSTVTKSCVPWSYMTLKSMTLDPDSKEDTSQSKPILSPIVTDGSFLKLVGAAGTVKITAPLPTVDSGELPL